MLRLLLRRALMALTILLAGAASVMLGFTLAGPARAGAVLDQTSTTHCPPFGCPATTLPPTTSPPSTAPPTTSAPSTAPPTTQPPVQQTVPPTTAPPRTTVPPSTTTTTLPAIGGNLPVTPSTVPFTTKQESSHVSPVFAALSGAGFFLALVIVGVRFWLTRPPS